MPEWPFFRHIRYWFLLVLVVLVVSALLWPSFRWGEHLLMTNVRNVALVQSLCLQPDCPVPTDDHLILKSEPGDDWRRSAGLNACQQLWLSRLYMAESPAKAATALEAAKACPRQDLVNAWGGNLAWAQGDRSLAYEFWSLLPASSLVRIGNRLILQEEVERGRTMLELVLERYGADLSGSNRRDLHTGLGHSYRAGGDWAKALHHYAQAVGLDPMDIESRFFLGMSLREDHQPDRALSVLEAGLDNLPVGRPGFVATYLVQLGLAYAAVGRTESALETFRSAQDWLAKERATWPETQRFIEEQIEGLVPQSKGHGQQP